MSVFKKLVADVALILQHTVVNLVYVNVQQFGRAKSPSTVRANMVVLLCPAPFPRDVLVRLLLCQELLLRADWGEEDYVRTATE
jgi:hypothetical protein